MRQIYGEGGFSDESLEALFNEFDMSKDGLIDINELGRFLNQVHGPAATGEDKELWAMVSNKPYINFKRFKNSLQGNGNIDQIANRINHEGNPNITFWQFLRAKGTEERRIIDSLIRNPQAQKDSDIMFMSMDNHNQFNSHQPSLKASMVGPQYQKRPGLAGRSMVKNKLCLKKDRPRPRRDMYGAIQREHVKVSRSPGVLLRDNGLRANPRASPPKSQVYVQNPHNSRYRSRSPYNQNVQNTRYRNTSKPNDLNSI